MKPGWEMCAQEGKEMSLVGCLCHRSHVTAEPCNSQSVPASWNSKTKNFKALMISSLSMCKAGGLNRPTVHTFWVMHSTPQRFGRY